MDAPVAEPVQEPVVDAGSANDPFALDEARFASLSPEQRAALDPVFEEWKGKAKQEIEKTGKTYEEKYRPAEEKAKALDELVRDQRFVSWWRNLQQEAAKSNPQGRTDISQSKPQDVATPEEWQQAIIDGSNGDHRKMQELQTRAWTLMATPIIQEVRAGQAELRTTLEMKDLFERHPDAKELDNIGRNLSDPKDQSESLLESCLTWAQDNRLPLEEGYARARRWAEALKVGAKQEAMGLVQEKKSSITSGPSTTKGGGVAIVEVADADELMQKQMEATINGDKTTRFVIRPPVANNRDRWSQKT